MNPVILNQAFREGSIRFEKSINFSCKSKPKNSPAKNKSHEQVDDEKYIIHRKKVQIKPS